jgi:DNA-directed RNA polymerase specialized sigma24 family protein
MATLPPFQKLLDEHSHDVLGFLVASVCPHDAEDCFQETFIAALRGYPKLDHADNLRGWLLTIAHRKAIDHHRAGTRRAVPAGSAEEVGGGVAVEEGSIEAAVRDGSWGSPACCRQSGAPSSALRRHGLWADRRDVDCPGRRAPQRRRLQLRGTEMTRRST